MACVPYRSTYAAGRARSRKAATVTAPNTAAVFFLRDNEPAQRLHQRLIAKHFLGDDVRVGPYLTDMSDTGDLPRCVPLRVSSPNRDHSDRPL